MSLAWGDPASAATVDGEYPNLALIRTAINALYRQLPAETIETFSVNLAPMFTRLPGREEPASGIRRIVRAMIRQLGLPGAPIRVEFRDAGQVGDVRLRSDYLVSLDYPHDYVASVLGPAVTRIFLRWHGISAPDGLDERLLTETASVYLGVGWPQLELADPAALLTTAEVAYILGKRAIAFDEDIEGFLSSPEAKQALREGRERAREDWHRAPLVDCGLRARFHYLQDRRRARRDLRRTAAEPDPAPPFEAYHFAAGDPFTVAFACPTCHHALRVPVRGTVTARCPLCRTVLRCDT